MVYNDTSIAQVVQEAKVTRGALYHHFKGKKELFIAITDEIESEVLGKMPWPSLSAPHPPVASSPELQPKKRDEVLRLILLVAVKTFRTNP
jgi:AcrR family transcriptional regulator